MVAGFVSLIGTLLGIIFWIMQRHARKADDPATQNEKRYAQIDRDLVDRDSMASTVHASNDLDELERLQNGRESH